MDVRYYAEPTTKLHHGSNLVKGRTPYPVFLPDVVRALIDTYRHYSGAERLRRLGADLLEGVRDSGNDNHGHWGADSVFPWPRCRVRCHRGLARMRRRRT